MWEEHLYIRDTQNTATRELVLKQKAKFTAGCMRLGWWWASIGHFVTNTIVMICKVTHKSRFAKVWTGSTHDRQYVRIYTRQLGWNSNSNTMEPDQSQNDPAQPLTFLPVVTPPSRLCHRPAVSFLHVPLNEFLPPQGKKWCAFKNVFQNFCPLSTIALHGVARVEEVSPQDYILFLWKMA